MISSKQAYKFRLCKFVPSKLVADLRDPIETRKLRADRYARKNKTCGKKAVFS